MKKLKPLLAVVGGIAVVATSFIGTLFVLNYFDRRTRDALRIEHAAVLTKALERYRASNGKYPSPFMGNLVSDLKPALVDGGYLRTIPIDPIWTTAAKQYGYVSPDGTNYGLYFHLESYSEKLPADGACITGIVPAGSGWWGNPPACPF